MISLDSMDASQIQSTLNLVKTQVTTYRTMLTSYKVAYNNATSKLTDAKQLLNSAKSVTLSVPDQIPLPKSLFGGASVNTNVSSSAVKTVSLQNLKDKAEDRILDLEEKIDELEGWQQKLEKKLEDLNEKANEYKDSAVAYVKQQAISVASTVVSGASKLVTGAISKGENKAKITTETVKDNDLAKTTVSKDSPLTNIS